jgi:hypothetical protein
MPEVKFISRVGTLGEDRMIINIPKEYHKQVKAMKGKQIVVTIIEAL